MLDITAFRNRFPEFRGVDASLVQSVLDDAAARLSVAVFGASINEAHGWKAAHLLASHPWGHTARLDLKGAGMKDETVYSAAWARLVSERASMRGIT